MKNGKTKAILSGLLCVLICAAIFEPSAASEAKRIFMHIDSEAYYENPDVYGATELFIDLLPMENISLAATVYSGDEYDYCKTFEIGSINDKETVKSFISRGYKDVRSDYDNFIEESDNYMPYLIFFTDKASINSTLIDQYGDSAQTYTVRRLGDAISLIHIICGDTLEGAEVLPPDKGVFVANVENTNAAEVNIILFGDDISSLKITNPIGERKEINGSDIYQSAGKGYLVIKLITPSAGEWGIECAAAYEANVLMFNARDRAGSIITKDGFGETGTDEERVLATPSDDTPANKTGEIGLDNTLTQGRVGAEPRITQMQKIIAELITISILCVIFLLVYFYSIKLKRPFNARLIYSVENDNEIIDTGSISLQNTSGRFVFENSIINIKENFSVAFYAADNPEIIKAKNMSGNTIIKSTLPQKRKFKFKRGKALCIKADGVSVFVTFLNNDKKNSGE